MNNFAPLPSAFAAPFALFGMQQRQRVHFEHFEFLLVHFCFCCTFLSFVHPDVILSIFCMVFLFILFVHLFVCFWYRYIFCAFAVHLFYVLFLPAVYVLYIFLLPSVLPFAARRAARLLLRAGVHGVAPVEYTRARCTKAYMNNST